MQPWARLALEAALRARAAKPPAAQRRPSAKPRRRRRRRASRRQRVARKARTGATEPTPVDDRALVALPGLDDARVAAPQRQALAGLEHVVVEVALARHPDPAAADGERPRLARRCEPALAEVHCQTAIGAAYNCVFIINLRLTAKYSHRETNIAVHRERIQ